MGPLLTTDFGKVETHSYVSVLHGKPAVKKSPNRPNQTIFSLNNHRFSCNYPPYGDLLALRRSIRPTIAGTGYSKFFCFETNQPLTVVVRGGEGRRSGQGRPGRALKKRRFPNRNYSTSCRYRACPNSHRTLRGGGSRTRLATFLSFPMICFNCI